MNDRARIRLTVFARAVVAGVAVFAVFSPSEIGAQPTPTPSPRLRRLDARAVRGVVAEVPTGAIEGRVTDRNGSALPGVTCRANNPDTGVTREATTDETGVCRLSSIPAGTYRFEAVRTGFFNTQASVAVAPGRTTTTSVTMNRSIILGPPVDERPPPRPAPRPPPAPPAPPPPPPSPPPAATPLPDTAPPPEPTGPPRDGRPPGPTPAAVQRIGQVFWNSWIKHHDREQAAAEMTVGQKYDLNFDLAAFNYQTFRQAPATTSIVVEGSLREILDTFEGDSMNIYVKPILAGRGLEFLPQQAATRSVEVKMKPLREPPTDWSRDDPLPEIATKVKAARVGIAVRAVEPGCASIGLSIWNDALDRPIDYVVRTLRVGGAVDDPACIGRGTSAKPLQGNFAALLSVRPDLPADAALHVFEMAPGTDDPKSYAVFVAQRGPMLSWTLARHLSKYVTEPSGLLNRLSVARSSREYRFLADELKEVLFHGDPGQEQADAAFDALSELARRPQKPTVFVRLADLKGKGVFLPLGLTAIRNGRLLGDAANVIQPLPRETYTAEQRCVQSWKMVLPEDLGSAVGGSFLTPITSPMSNRTSSWSDLETYLRNPAADSSRSEGFLLLAHQGGGRLWFVPDTPSSMITDQISHKFPPGSVAVLSACSVGDLSAESSGIGLLEKLNALGIDAVILSPFAVNGPVGARFAFHFADEIQKAQQGREAARLVDLFQRATAATRQDMTIAAERNGVYEFLLAGNGGLRLCR